MELRQPYEVNGFTFKSHAVSHLLRNGLPAQLLARRCRQRLPAMNGFYITHDWTITATTGLSNLIHASMGKPTRLPATRVTSYAVTWTTRFISTFNQRRFIMAVLSFPLGNVVITPNALGQLTHADIQLGLQRHQAGDWGELDEHDKQENERALGMGLRLLSSYRAAGGVNFWIITEADRSVTTLLLPEDY